MMIRTYRAKTIQEALDLVRRDLGPDAAVLHTREVRPGMLGWFRSRQVEVAASSAVHVPSRFPKRRAPTIAEQAARTSPPPPHEPVGRAEAASPRIVPPDNDSSVATAPDRREPDSRGADLETLLAGLPTAESPSHGLSETFFRLFTDLIDAEVSEELARELIQRVRTEAHEVDDLLLLKARIARMIEDEITVTGPIQVRPGQRRVVALVGPTGVGKTTTIAKLAANYHLKQRRRVGLITVDTYRIAAVDQLRTYADIMDVPMEVVSTPRDLRDALQRLSGVDLILMDTAGRSPRDEVKIQELKSVLAEAQADEVHLVLSAVSSLALLKKAAERFADVGVTSILFTKLDEATGLGNLLPLTRSCRLPLSYVTNGQNVPDDIAAADPRQLARIVLGMSG